MRKNMNASMLTKSFLLSCVLVIVFAGLAYSQEYRFRIHNNSGTTITQVLVSEDGSQWGRFDIGSGIRAGATVELVWSENTSDEACDQYFKAVFDDGSESEPVMFNFCENNLVLEF